MYTLGAVVLCGLLVALCEWMFKRLLGGGVGNKIILATSIIGTPIHELGHALMCLIFGHKITEMKLWDPRAKNGTLGHVRHSYNRRNIYHRLGNLFIGLGPIFSGLLIMILMLLIAFPDTLNTYVTTATEAVSSGERGVSVWIEGIKILPSLLSESATAPWLRAIAVLVMLSVSLHITLSPADIKGSLGALPIYLAGVLFVTLITAVIGKGAMDAVESALAFYNATLTALFAIVLIFSLILVLFALAVFLLRTLFGMIFGKRR